MNKKQLVFLVLVVSVGLAVHAQQGGYKGPGTTSVTVEEAKDLPNISLVILQGKIERRFLETQYLFADDTGRITLVIDDRVWGNVSVDEHDEVEITGIITRARDGRGGTHIVSVRSLRKL
ncbi:MAG: NirD/YgiW/YdeI family stress tolerance protein [Treponema sp.]|nr:NirD/YgiW/YdeI family stress tolerance protein [Treponema sp.]